MARHRHISPDHDYFALKIVEVDCFYLVYEANLNVITVGCSKRYSSLMSLFPFSGVVRMRDN